VRQVCIYHAGCPDGFGAAWAAWRAWGEKGVYVPRGHEDPLRAEDYVGDRLVFADIAPPPRAARALLDRAGELVILDHHVSALERYQAEPGLLREIDTAGHLARFDLSHSGAVLAWEHLHPGEPVPELLRYVEDQDLWRFALPDSREVNAALGSHPRAFGIWTALAEAPIADLAREGVPILRAERVEVERALQAAHPIHLAEHTVEAVNARVHRSRIGHELATRAAFGVPCGAVYRMQGRRVDVSIYAVGDFDVSKLAGAYGGGGHRSAAGFSVTLEEWLARFV
jgi:oligoribonuclease NrnB/cAMP/cGMP phosphodiesterase (DHH superfamily)